MPAPLATEQLISEPPSEALAETAAAGSPTELAAAGPPPDLLRGLIALADNLVDLTEQARGPESGVHTLRLVQRRVDQLLIGCGVQIVCDDGPVVTSRHEVVAARPVGADGTEGWIAATVRSGYLHGDRLIRPQQVVAYTVEQPAGNEQEGERR